jgi:O-antigen/teichoic acid export membrane protein
VTPKRGLGANAALAFAGDAALKLSALVVILVGARALTVPEFAVLATGLAVAGVLTMALDFGAGTLITRDGARSRDVRGALLAGSLAARAPVFVAVLVFAPLLGALVGRPWTALAIAALSVAGAGALTVLACYRSSQDIRPEALQRLGAGALTIVAVGALGLLVSSADAMLVALAVIVTVTIAPLALRIRTVADLTNAAPRGATIRRAAPIGLLALATVVYFRSGTIALAASSDEQATAAFGVAAGIAFGLLMLPNAVTTALLPRLAAEVDRRGSGECTRRVLAWTIALAALVATAAAVAIPALLPVALGHGYDEARAPFVVLCVGIPLIAASSVIGTALLSLGQVRVLGLQVAVSLAVNLLCLAILVPVAGAVGAAFATLACEAVGLVVLVHAARSALPGLVLPGRSEGSRIAPTTAVP